MSGSRITKWFAALMILAAAVYAFKFYRSSDSGDIKTSTNRGEVSRGDIVQRVTMIGTVNSSKTLLVRAPFKGFVRKIFVGVGDSVKIGSPLVSIAQSADQPNSEIFPLRSTMAGLVTQIQSSEGEAVSEMGGDDKYILRVDDLSSYSVSCDVPEVDVVKLKRGQKAIVKASAITDQQFDGEITTISLASSYQDRWNRGVVQYKVEVGIAGKAVQLRPGMTAMVDVITADRKGVLIIGHEFVEPEAGKYFVNLVDGPRVEIKVGLQDDVSFEIVDGLAEGQKVRQVDFVAAAKRNRGKS